MNNNSKIVDQGDDFSAFIAQYNGFFIYRKLPKRVIDVVLGLLILPILMPIVAILYVFIRMDGGAGFYGHQRVGKHGRIFRCWKLRTMTVDSEQRLQALLATDPDALAEWNRDHKLSNDPRITKLGKFLRKTSLDELPQIVNVLKGEMSLIGPRPVTQDELRRYGGFKSFYLAMRPGVTGLWQVSGRNDVTYDERVQLDVDYCKSVSFGKDMSILFKTVGAVAKQTGC